MCVGWWEGKGSLEQLGGDSLPGEGSYGSDCECVEGWGDLGVSKLFGYYQWLVRLGRLWPDHFFFFKGGRVLLV